MKRLCVRVAALAVMLIAGSCFGDGVLIVDRPPWIRPPWPIPIPPPMPPRPPAEPQPVFLPVSFHKVTVTIDNQIATTRVDQAFRNDSDHDLEATYLFPIPEDAAIREFSMYADGKKLTGEVLDKDKARKIYEEIVRKMRDPGLLEYVGRNLFKARVYPVPKRSEKRIELVYQQILKSDAGLVRYSYPLNTEKFSPTPLEVASISVKIASTLPIRSVYSPSHPVDAKLGVHEATCGWEEKNVKPDTDFVLYYALSEKDLAVNLFSFRRSGEDGYFLLLLSPGEMDVAPVDKDVVFVIDTSGSMSGGKIEQAKEALKFCVESLNPADRFNVISFATDVRKFKDALVPAGKAAKEEAVNFISGMKALGGTDIDSALATALAMFKDTSRPNMLVFLTDGQPTVGVTDMKTILSNAGKANTTRTRFFVFGVGSDVNSILLDRLAEEQNGMAEYVAPKENLEQRVSSFYRKINDPVLTDVKIDFGAIKTYDLLPRTVPDVFRGGQVLVTGRYSTSGATALTVTGNAGGKARRWTADASFVTDDRSADFVPNLWASRKIGFLMAEIRDKGEHRELVDEIVRLSKEFGILTPYTSFLILEDAERKGGRVDVPAPSPAAVPKAMYEAGRGISGNMQTATGADAFARSQTIQSLNRQSNVFRSQVEAVRQVADRTFTQQGNGWVDNQFRQGMQVRQVKYLSEEYFTLVRDEPELGRFLALGANVTVVHKGQAYQIVE